MEHLSENDRPFSGYTGPVQKKATDPLTAAGLGALGGASGWAASMALQRGMNLAKRVIWKHMSAKQKAKYLLKKVFGPQMAP